MEETVGQKSIADFFALERNRLVGYVRRLIDDAAERDGEDIVQDVALNLFSRADVTVPIEHLSAYVYQAIRNRVVDSLRRRKDTVSLDAPVHGDDDLSLANILADTVLDTESQVARSEIRRRVYLAIDELSDDQKAIIIETEFQGRTFQDLSLEWDIPIGTLLSRKSRAMARIKSSLQDLKP
jgi:RNA polymerase sigma factor (sigma-70 family)